MMLLAHNFDNVLVKLNLSFVGKSERHFLCQTFALCIKRLVKLNPFINFIDILFYTRLFFVWKLSVLNSSSLVMVWLCNFLAQEYERESCF